MELLIGRDCLVMGLPKMYKDARKFKLKDEKVTCIFK